MWPFLGFGESAEVRSRWVLHNLIGAGAGSEIDVPRGTNPPTALVCGRKFRVAPGLASLRPSTVWGPTLVGVLHGMPGGDGCSQRVLQGRVPSHETRRVRGGHHQGVLSLQQADVPRGTFVNVRGGSAIAAWASEAAYRGGEGGGALHLDRAAPRRLWALGRAGCGRQRGCPMVGGCHVGGRSLLPLSDLSGPEVVFSLQPSIVPTGGCCRTPALLGGFRGGSPSELLRGVSGSRRCRCMFHVEH